MTDDDRRRLEAEMVSLKEYTQVLVNSLEKRTELLATEREKQAALSLLLTQRSIEKVEAQIDAVERVTSRIAGGLLLLAALIPLVAHFVR